MSGKRFALLMLLLLVSCAGAQVPRMTYRNPIIQPTAADPSVIKGGDGRFYLAATQDSWGGRLEHFIPIFVSDDLVEWEFLTDVFTLPPAWKEGGGFLWAPDLSYVDGIYRLYYAYSQWGDSNPCIGMATASEPGGPWQDLGRPVFCSLDIGVKNSIDPFVWREEGKATMIWGSFHGIYAIGLDEEAGRPAGGTVLLAGDRFEAPYLIRHGGYYYLFLSSGSCCEGAESSYITWVGRSAELYGPYQDSIGRDLRYSGGEVVLYRNDDWVGPGHVAVIQDDAGQDWLFYHAVSPQKPHLPNGATRRPALLDQITWVEGWPSVHDGAGPSARELPGPVLE